MNIAIGPDTNAVSLTTPFVSSVAQLDGSFNGLGSWAGPFLSFVVTILTHTSLSAVVEVGPGSLFATRWRPCGHFSATALKQDGLRHIWWMSFKDPEFTRRRSCQQALRGPISSDFLRSWTKIVQR